MPGIVIASIIGAGAAVGSSVIQSQAAKSAAKTQSQSADRAIALQREQYGQQQQRLQPFQQVAAPALGRLQQMAGVPVSAPPSASLPPRGQPRTMGQMGQPSERMIPMRAPDGSVRPVPESSVQYFQQRGAEIIYG